jgi:hypothetical protein
LHLVLVEEDFLSFLNTFFFDDFVEEEGLLLRDGIELLDGIELRDGIELGRRDGIELRDGIVLGVELGRSVASGETLSTTVTLKKQVVSWPRLSLYVTLTVVFPRGNRSPLACDAEIK